MTAMEILRQLRTRANLSQRELAERLGLTQSTLSGWERGTRQPTVTSMEQLAAAVGYRLTWDLTSIDAELDESIDELAQLSVKERLRRGPALFDCWIGYLAPLDYLVDGATAALIQGAPVHACCLDLVLARRSLQEFVQVLSLKAHGRRWNEARQDWVWEEPDPQHREPVRWWTAYGEITVQIVEELPEPLHLTYGDFPLPVRPLVAIELNDLDLRQILQRTWTRTAAAGAQRDSEEPGRSVHERPHDGRGPPG
jgi:transcriptional regulator with XRE-family HTH domain